MQTKSMAYHNGQKVGLNVANRLFMFLLQVKIL
jgi:hypothetical protein